MSSIKNLTVRGLKYPIASKYDGEDNDIVKTYATKIELATGIAMATTTINDKDSGHITLTNEFAEDGHIIYTIHESDIAADSALTTEITARKTVDGQSGQVYEANASANYINEATDLNDADVKLDSSLKIESDRAIAQENTIEAAVGLAEDGTHITTTGNYTKDATTITGEISDLDTALKTESDRAIAQENTLESSIGLSDSGEHITTTGNYTNEATTITGEISALDTALKTESDRAIAQENTLENSIGLAEDGTYITTTGNYTSEATTITESIAALDVQLKNTNDSLQTEITRASNAESTLTSNVAANTSNIGNLISSLNSVKTNLENEITRAQTAESTNKEAIELLNGQSEGSVTSSINNAINQLNVSQVGSNSTYIKNISETNGKISAVSAELISTSISRTPTSETDTIVSIKGTNIEEALISLATSIKSVKTVPTKYSIDKITENLEANIQEAYQLIETVDGISTQVGTPIPVYKDSSLKSVQLVSEKPSDVEGGDSIQGQFLQLTYILVDDTTSTQYIDVQAFLAEATYKEGLQVKNSGEVSIKLDETSKFLSVSEKGLKLDSIENTPTTSNLVTVPDTIQVTGGPLAPLLNAAGITKINKGQDLQSLLLSLFTKELWGDPIFTEGTLTAQVSQPNFTVSKTLVKVGSTITIGACSTFNTTYTSTSRNLSHLDYGYSTNGSTIISETSLTKNISNIFFSGKNTLTRVIAGKSEQGESLSETTYAVKEGNNVVTVTASGQTVTGSFEQIPSVYICSNLGQINNEHKTDVYNSYTITTKVPTSQKSITIVGVYPIFATTSDINTLTEQPLSSSKTYTLDLVPEVNNNRQSFAIPASKKLSKVSRYNSLGKPSYVDFDLSNFDTETKEMNIEGTAVNYVVYKRNDTVSGNVILQITIE